MNLDDILEVIGKENVMGIAPIQEATEGDLVFCRGGKNARFLIQNTKANIIICDSEIDVEGIKNKILIRVDNAGLWFVRTIKRLFPLESQPMIHPTASINDCVKLGKNVRIGAGCRIGFAGHGYEKNESGGWERFPHHGNVIIEDNVEIGENTCVARGTLSDTIIGSGTKIDALVHIGHNARIGKNCYITAKCGMGRSNIGDEVYIGLGSLIRPGVNVGKGAFIGMGSVVVKDVEEYTEVYGVPAKFVRRVNE